MNKEEIDNMYKVLKEQWGDSDNYINDLLNYSKNLQKKNKQLKEDYAKIIQNNCYTLELEKRIEKAREYIKKNSFDKQEKPMIWVRVFKKDLHGYANDL